MAAFPPLPQIVGSHGHVYEAYFSQADPTGSGSVGSLDAAMFLKKSGLGDVVLSQVWYLSDPTGKGYLEKTGFCVALKLISLLQSGQDLNMGKLILETPAPNLGPVPEQHVSPAMSASNIPWVIQVQEKSKYDQVFDSLQPANGMLSGDKVRPVLLNSKLPMDMLGRVWELSDIDADGFLDREEFAVAMHLVYRALENDPVPMSLPPRLIPPSKRKAGVGVPLPGAIPVLPPLPMGHNSPGPKTDSQVPAKQATWVVSATDKLNCDTIFKKADLDNDGFVGGGDVRDIFLQSGLQNNVLAHIWSLCDIKGTAKLNNEQFALAMYFIQLKIKGVEPPTQLTPDMVPPTLRPKPGSDPGAFGVMDGTNSGPYSHVADFSAIKELDHITKEIDDIKRDKIHEEKNRAQYEADIKIRNGEVQTAQKELDAITSTLQQLENQKKEAQKRLDELDDKRSNLERNVKEYQEKCEEEEKLIHTLKSQITNQEKSVKDQESELDNLRVELNTLRDSESQLEQNVEAGKQQLELLAKSHKDIHLQINQAKTKVQHLQDQQRALSQSIGSYQINGDLSSTPISTIDSDFLSTRATAGSSPVSTMSNFSMGSAVDDFKDDPFKGKDPFSSSGEASTLDPFQNQDPFKENDPFKSETFTSDPFASEDPFKEAFPSATAAAQNDPFGGSDPFSGAFSSPKNKSSGFDPFGSSSGGSSSTKKAGTDLFGSDPFSPKNRSKRTESPTPALPPKQKKHPPPRPAPPRPKHSPAPVKPATTDLFGSDPFAGNDPFSNSSPNTADAFANFADFSPSKTSSGDADIAWALEESKQLEKERKRIAKQEDSDLKRALALSQKDNKSRESEA